MRSQSAASMTRSEFAIQLARSGGAILMKYFRQELQIEMKGSGNLVSQADLESERVIVEMIQRHFPGDAIIAEEGHATQQAAERLWIIDPLDGTNNFAHGIAQFAVSVAYYENGQALCGAVLNPAREELYTATRGGGAFRNGAPLRVSCEASLDESLISTGFYYDRGEMMRRTLRTIEALFGRGIHGIRRFGAAALDLCGVAAGEYGAFFEFQLAPWDFAAGRLIVEEAGGTVSDCSGLPLEIKTSSILASNSKLHQKMLELFKSVP